MNILTGCTHEAGQLINLSRSLYVSMRSIVNYQWLSSSGGLLKPQLLPVLLVPAQVFQGRRVGSSTGTTHPISTLLKNITDALYLSPLLTTLLERYQQGKVQFSLFWLH